MTIKDMLIVAGARAIMIVMIAGFLYMLWYFVGVTGK